MESNDASDVEHDTSNNSVGSDARKRGRVLSTVWRHFTDEADPHKTLAATCKHCKQSVNYHKKSEQVIVHMNKCSEFKAAMMKIPVGERPGWYRSVKRSAKGASPLPAAETSAAKTQMQTLMTDFRLPSLTSLQKREFKRLMALHYYNRNTPFAHIECPLLEKALKILRPDVEIPNRRNLAGDLLDSSFAETKTKVERIINDPDELVCYTTDAWSNVNRDSVVTYMGVFKNATVFTEAVYTGQQKHTAEWISADLQRVIDGTKGRVTGACTDNTKTNKSAWRMLKGTYPAKFFYGCVCHALHLFVKDIFGAKKKIRGNEPTPSYPPLFPFEEKLLFVEKCKELVQFIRNHQVVKAMLEEMQAAAKVPKLAPPAPTRWGYIRATLESIFKSEGVLYAMVSQRDFLPGPRDQRSKRAMVYELVTSPTFVSTLKACIALLESTDKRIKHFESDRKPLSDVHDSFAHIRAEIQLLDVLTADEKAYMLGLVTKRFAFIDSDAHGISYLLDPRYLGDALTCDDRERIEDLVTNFPQMGGKPSTPARQVILMKQLCDFNDRSAKARRDRTQRFRWVEEGHKTVREYWMEEGKRWPDLQEIGLAVFSLVTSSASSERNFSTFGLVHSKLRNKLKEKSIKKLVYIKTNYNSFEDTKVTLDDSDGEDDSL